MFLHSDQGLEVLRFSARRELDALLLVPGASDHVAHSAALRAVRRPLTILGFNANGVIVFSEGYGQRVVPYTSWAEHLRGSVVMCAIITDPAMTRGREGKRPTVTAFGDCLASLLAFQLAFSSLSTNAVALHVHLPRIEALGSFRRMVETATFPTQGHALCYTHTSVVCGRRHTCYRHTCSAVAPIWRWRASGDGDGWWTSRTTSRGFIVRRRAAN